MVEKHTFTNLGRILISSSIFWFIFANKELESSLPLISIHFFFSLLWFVIIQSEILIEANYSWTGYIPASIDNFMLFLLINISGGIFSFLLIGFLISAALSSVVLNPTFGRFSSSMSFFFYASSGLLLKYDLIHNYNYFTKQKTEFTFPIYIMACFVMGVGLFIMHHVVNSNIIKNHELQMLSENSRQKAESALLELKESKDALSRAERTSSLNQMAAFVSHEINNPLNFILTQLYSWKEHFQELQSLILSVLPENEETKEFRNRLNHYFQELEDSHTEIQSASNRIRDIVTEVKSITSIHGISLSSVEIQPLLIKTIEETFSKNQIPTDLFSIELPSPHLSIQNNSSILRRVFQILFSYAIHTSKPDLIQNLKIKIQEKQDNQIFLYLYYTGRELSEEEFRDIQNSQKQISLGLEQFGIPFAKDLAKSIQCNFHLLEFGKNQGKHEVLVILKNL